MRNQGQIFIGVVVTLIGLAFLIGNVLDIDVGDLCLPTLLICLGIWLLVRPRLISPDKVLRTRVFGPIRRSGVWQVTEEELWIFVGDIRLDFSRAEIPVGETQMRVSGFVGNIRVRVPPEVGVAVSSTAFITDAKVLGRKREGLLTPVHLTSDGYETAERKVRLDLTFFIADLAVREAEEE